MALKSLVIKESELTENLIEKVVSPYIQYTETGKIVPNQNFRKLTIQQQLLVYLTAKSGLPIAIDDPSISVSAENTELEKTLNIKGNTLRPRLSELRKNGYIITEDGKHKISNHAANYIIEELKIK